MGEFREYVLAASGTTTKAAQRRPKDQSPCADFESAMTKLYRDFIHSTSRLYNKAEIIATSPINHRDWRFRYASITLISEMWQICISSFLS